MRPLSPRLMVVVLVVIFAIVSNIFSLHTPVANGLLSSSLRNSLWIARKVPIIGDYRGNVVSHYRVSSSSVTSLHAARSSIKNPPLRQLKKSLAIFYLQNELRLSDNAIMNIVLKHSWIMYLQVDTNIRPTVDVLLAYGFRRKDVRMMVERIPSVLAINCDTTLPEKLNSIQKMFHLNKINVVKIVASQPLLLTCSIDRNLGVSGFLSDVMGFSPDQIRKLLLKRPIISMSSLRKLSLCWSALTDLYGVSDHSARSLCLRFPLVLSEQVLLQIDDRVHFFSQELQMPPPFSAIQHIIERYPPILYLNCDVFLRPNVAVLRHVLELDSEQLYKLLNVFPQLLGYNPVYLQELCERTMYFLTGEVQESVGRNLIDSDDSKTSGRSSSSSARRSNDDEHSANSDRNDKEGLINRYFEGIRNSPDEYSVEDETPAEQFERTTDFLSALPVEAVIAPLPASEPRPSPRSPRPQPLPLPEPLLWDGHTGNFLSALSDALSENSVSASTVAVDGTSSGSLMDDNNVLIGSVVDSGDSGSRKVDGVDAGDAGEGTEPSVSLRELDIIRDIVREFSFSGPNQQQQQQQEESKPVSQPNGRMDSVRNSVRETPRGNVDEEPLHEWMSNVARKVIHSKFGISQHHLDQLNLSDEGTVIDSHAIVQRPAGTADVDDEEETEEEEGKEEENVEIKEGRLHLSNNDAFAVVPLLSSTYTEQSDPASASETAEEEPTPAEVSAPRRSTPLKLSRERALYIIRSAPWVLAYKEDRSRAVLACLAVSLGMTRKEIERCVSLYARIFSLSTQGKLHTYLRAVALFASRQLQIEKLRHSSESIAPAASAFATGAATDAVNDGDLSESAPASEASNLEQECDASNFAPMDDVKLEIEDEFDMDYVRGFLASEEGVRALDSAVAAVSVSTPNLAKDFRGNANGEVLLQEVNEEGRQQQQGDIKELAERAVLTSLQHHRNHPVRARVRRLILRYPPLLGMSMDRLIERLDAFLALERDWDSELLTVLRRSPAAHGRWVAKMEKMRAQPPVAAATDIPSSFQSRKSTKTPVSSTSSTSLQADPRERKDSVERAARVGASAQQSITATATAVGSAVSAATRSSATAVAAAVASIAHQKLAFAHTSSPSVDIISESVTSFPSVEKERGSFLPIDSKIILKKADTRMHAEELAEAGVASMAAAVLEISEEELMTAQKKTRTSNKQKRHGGGKGSIDTASGVDLTLIADAADCSNSSSKSSSSSINFEKSSFPSTELAGGARAASAGNDKDKKKTPMASPARVSAVCQVSSAPFASQQEAKRGAVSRDVTARLRAMSRRRMSKAAKAGKVILPNERYVINHSNDDVLSTGNLALRAVRKTDYMRVHSSTDQLSARSEPVFETTGRRRMIDDEEEEEVREDNSLMCSNAGDVYIDPIKSGSRGEKESGIDSEDGQYPDVMWGQNTQERQTNSSKHTRTPSSTLQEEAQVEKEKELELEESPGAERSLPVLADASPQSRTLLPHSQSPNLASTSRLSSVYLPAVVNAVDTVSAADSLSSSLSYPYLLEAALESVFVSSLVSPPSSAPFPRFSVLLSPIFPPELPSSHGTAAIVDGKGRSGSRGLRGLISAEAMRALQSRMESVNDDGTITPSASSSPSPSPSAGPSRAVAMAAIAAMAAARSAHEEALRENLRREHPLISSPSLKDAADSSSQSDKNDTGVSAIGRDEGTGGWEPEGVASTGIDSGIVTVGDVGREAEDTVKAQSEEIDEVNAPAGERSQDAGNKKGSLNVDGKGSLTGSETGGRGEGGGEREGPPDTTAAEVSEDEERRREVVQSTRDRFSNRVKDKESNGKSNSDRDSGGVSKDVLQEIHSLILKRESNDRGRQ